MEIRRVFFLNVHESITAHSRKQHDHLVRFEELDREREAAIAEAIARCGNGEPFDVDRINEATARINAHAKHGISPTRKYVTIEMVKQFVFSSKP
ncbi:YpbS family protein [Paenibacillus sp. TRM 82003]|nr:YpbS family protein [Paenibacillus sp. TRM 82003]